MGNPVRSVTNMTGVVVSAIGLFGAESFLNMESQTAFMRKPVIPVEHPYVRDFRYNWL